MFWKGNELLSYGDIMTKGIDCCDTREEAQEFMRLYREENEYADANIGYLSGYCSPERMAEIQELFGVSHPVFGKSIPTPKEAFETGLEAGSH